MSEEFHPTLSDGTQGGRVEDVTIRGVSLLGGGSVFHGVVRTLEDTMKIFLFKAQSIYDSFS